MIRRIDTRHHVREECMRRQVLCLHRDLGCQAVFPLGDRDEHERMYCTFVQLRDRIVEDSAEERAAVTCPNCSERMPHRDLVSHQKEDCPHRLVPCSHSDCKSLLQAHDLARHLRYECASQYQKNKAFLVEIARRKRNYPRPWGAEINIIKAKNGENDENDELIVALSESENDVESEVENDNEDRESSDGDGVDYRKYEI